MWEECGTFFKKDNLLLNDDPQPIAPHSKKITHSLCLLQGKSHLILTLLISYESMMNGYMTLIPICMMMVQLKGRNLRLVLRPLMRCLLRVN